MVAKLQAVCNSSVSVVLLGNHLCSKHRLVCAKEFMSNRLCKDGAASFGNALSAKGSARNWWIQESKSSALCLASESGGALFAVRASTGGFTLVSAWVLKVLKVPMLIPKIRAAAALQTGMLLNSRKGRCTCFASAMLGKCVNLRIRLGIQKDITHKYFQPWNPKNAFPTKYFGFDCPW